MSLKDLHPQTSWLYGVVVALAIREGIAEVIPSITDPKHLISGWSLQLQGFRLVVFLLTLVRFYLGSVQYFNEVHVNKALGGNGETYRRKNYGFDFTSGLTHFLIFFAWATTINSSDHWHGRLSHFALAGGVVLLYDLLWLALSFKWDTWRQIAIWAVINGFTVLVCLLLLFIGPGDEVSKEELAIAWVFLVGIIDTWGIISDRNIIKDGMIKMLGGLPPPPPPPTPS